MGCKIICLRNKWAVRLFVSDEWAERLFVSDKWAERLFLGDKFFDSAVCYFIRPRKVAIFPYTKKLRLTMN
jgi:hypothetical protein